eukprot:135084_1
MCMSRKANKRKQIHVAIGVCMSFQINSSILFYTLPVESLAYCFAIQNPNHAYAGLTINKAATRCIALFASNRIVVVYLFAINRTAIIHRRHTHSFLVIPALTASSAPPLNACQLYLPDSINTAINLSFVCCVAYTNKAYAWDEFNKLEIFIIILIILYCDD